MKSTTKRLPQGDSRAVWHEAVRDVRPLRSREPPLDGLVPAPPTDAAVAERGPVAPASRFLPLDYFADIDRATVERLKRGRRRIEARLDLHGMTQAEAHRSLSAFVVASRNSGRRCVLIITGRGLGPNGSGVLKSAVPRWLEQPELRRHVLAIAPAQPQHGGAGASYLLLRRRP